MQEYHLHKEARPHVHRPQILGLTASPVFNTKGAEAQFRALEASLDSIIVTARDSAAEAASYFTKPKERALFYTMADDYTPETDFELLLEDLEIWEHVNADKVLARIANVKKVSETPIYSLARSAFVAQY